MGTEEVHVDTCYNKILVQVEKRLSGNRKVCGKSDKDFVRSHSTCSKQHIGLCQQGIDNLTLVIEDDGMTLEREWLE